MVPVGVTIILPTLSVVIVPMWPNVCLRFQLMCCNVDLELACHVLGIQQPFATYSLARTG